MTALFNSARNNKLFKFYTTYLKLQYEVWTLKKISTMKRIEEMRLEEFTNYKLTIMRGSKNKQSIFTIVDIPTMNPYD